MWWNIYQALVDAANWLRRIFICSRKGHRWNAPADFCHDFGIICYCTRCDVEHPEWRERP